MPGEPTVADVCRLAPFRVLAPGHAAELRRYTYVERTITGVTLAAGGVEVTTERLPAHDRSGPERRARDRLAQLIDDAPATPGEPWSAPGQYLDAAAVRRQASVRAAAAPATGAMIETDGVPVRFARVEHENCWAAVADIGDERITIAARDVPATEVALRGGA